MSQSTRIKFYGTTFQVSTGFGTANPLTGISNANPAVVTDPAHGIVDAAVIKIENVVGMTQINDTLAVVDVIDANSYRLLGVNSLNFDTYTSGGTARVATFSGSCEVTGYTGNSGSTTETTTETNCGKAIDFGAPDPGSVSLSYNKAPGSFQNAIEQARKDVSTVALKTTLPANKGIMIDIGTITEVGNAGASGGLWTGSANLRRITDRIDQ